MAAARDPRTKALKLVALASGNKNAHERDAALLALGKLVAAHPEWLEDARPAPRTAGKSRGDVASKVADAVKTASADPRVKRAAAEAAQAVWDAFVKR